MTTHLPSRPDLGQLKRQAKNLLKAHQQGDVQVCSTLRQLHRFAHSSDSDILASDLKLHEVQFAFALDYGFSSWNALKSHVESLSQTTDGPVVHKKDGAAWIDGIPKLDWKDPGACTFIGALQRTLNRIGTPINYHDLMGISGAAFRFCFAHPRWDWSSVDGMLGYDHGQAAMDALGYEVSWAEAEDFRDAVKTSIDNGIPAMGIDLVVAAEWGVITGYAEDAKVLLCRTYFDDPKDQGYSRTERVPWLNYFIGKRKGTLTRRESLSASLRIADMFAHADDFTSFGGCHYMRGFEAFETWMSDLKDESRFNPEDPDAVHLHASVNRFIYDSLIDARISAAHYLKNHADLLGEKLRAHLLEASYSYEQIVSALRAGDKMLPSTENAENLDPHEWTSDMRREQIETLEEVLRLERQAIRVVRYVLDHTG